MTTRLKKYLITLQGCDDSTPFHLFLYPHEVTIIETLSQRSIEASNSPCEPILLLEEVER